MFIFILNYQKGLDMVETYLDDHKTYLDVNYKSGAFIASGRQEPRTGGVILCRAENRLEALKIMQQDPFFIHKVAKYDIIEFVPSKYASGFECFI